MPWRWRHLGCLTEHRGRSEQVHGTVSDEVALLQLGQVTSRIERWHVDWVRDVPSISRGCCRSSGHAPRRGKGRPVGTGRPFLSELNRAAGRRCVTAVGSIHPLTVRTPYMPAIAATGKFEPSSAGPGHTWALPK